MRNVSAVLLAVFIFTGCNKTNDDSRYFNGDIHIADDSKRIVVTTPEEVPINGIITSEFCVYDTLAIFWEWKFESHYFTIHNINNGKFLGNYSSKGRGPTESGDMSDAKHYYMRIQADNNYIYALYLGEMRNPFGANEIRSHIVNVFDWNGNLVGKLDLVNPVTQISLDSKNNILYGINPITEKFYRYDLNSVSFD